MVELKCELRNVDLDRGGLHALVLSIRDFI